MIRLRVDQTAWRRRVVGLAGRGYPRWLGWQAAIIVKSRFAEAGLVGLSSRDHDLV